MKSFGCVLAGLLLLLAMTAPAAAFEVHTLRLGGPGGAVFDDPCFGNDALVGIDGVSGKDLDQVTTVCQDLSGGRLDGGIYTKGTWGRGGEGGPESSFVGELTVRCPPNMAVQSIRVTESSVRVVHTFQLSCRNLITGQHADTGWSDTVGGRGGSPGVADCGNDGYAVGLWGGYGSLVDALALICATYQPAPAANPTPPGQKPVKVTGAAPKPKASGNPPLRVDNGNNGDQGDNGNSGDQNDGGGARAATDTTIYDHPEGSDVAYLSAGDVVTIVRCNDNNWCQISQPERGWVWGDDLDR